MADYNVAATSADQGRVVPPIGRGRTMETMLSFVKTSPPGYKNNNYAGSSVTLMDNSCNCDRPMRNILCKSCGCLCRGRVQMRCPCHQNVIHLMDISVCPNCQANTLKEFGVATAKK